MVELFANRGDPDQMPYSTAFDLGLHCLPVTHSGVSSLQWVNIIFKSMTLTFGLKYKQNDANRAVSIVLKLPHINKFK